MIRTMILRLLPPMIKKHGQFQPARIILLLAMALTCGSSVLGAPQSFPIQSDDQFVPKRGMDYGQPSFFCCYTTNKTLCVTNQMYTTNGVLSTTNTIYVTNSILYYTEPDPGEATRHSLRRLEGNMVLEVQDPESANHQKKICSQSYANSQCLLGSLGCVAAETESEGLPNRWTAKRLC
jgi:hypothetical protein